MHSCRKASFQVWCFNAVLQVTKTIKTGVVAQLICGWNVCILHMLRPLQVCFLDCPAIIQRSLFWNLLSFSSIAPQCVWGQPKQETQEEPVYSICSHHKGIKMQNFTCRCYRHCISTVSSVLTSSVFSAIGDVMIGIPCLLYSYVSLYQRSLQRFYSQWQLKNSGPSAP